MSINKNKLYENLLQLTEEQQQIVLDYVEKTAEANMALKRLAVHGAADIDLEADAGNVGFSNAVGSYVTGRMEFDIFHTISKRFCKKDFGGATESEQKSNIDAMILKQGIVVGRYYIGGANMTVILDYDKPEGDSGKYLVNVMMHDELSGN